MKTKLYSLLLAIMAGSVTLYASDTQVDGIWYDFNSSTLTASVTYRGSSYTSYSGEYTGSIAIPSSVTYNSVTYSITSIGTAAFQDCTDLTSVTIPNSVTSIESGAFYNCSGLTSIEIPNSVISIGNHAFYGCSALTSIEIPNSVTSIGQYAFSGCSGLTSPVYNAHVFAYMPTSYSGAYTIPEGIETITGGAFKLCSGLTSVTIPNSVTSIGNYAFSVCLSLTSVTCLGETPATIGEYALGNGNILVPCGTLDTYKSAWSNYADKIKYHSLEYSIFGKVNIEGAGSVEVPQTICDSLTAIPNYGYHFVQWSDGITDNPRTIELTQDTTFTAEFAISRTGTCGDDLLLTWTYDPSKKELTISGNGTLNGNYTFGLESPTNIQKLEIQSGVTSIGNSAFANEENITSIKLPNTLTSIGNHAFVNCKKLSDITIPESVTTIGKAAFKNGNRLENIILGAGIENIGDSAFANCPYILAVYAHMEYPPVINASVFADDGDLSLVDLFVPESALTRYKKTAVWKVFNLQVGQEPEPEPQDIYTISYIGHESAILGSEDVALHLPEAPEIEGFTFLGWRPVATFIESNTIVIEAVYESEGGTDLPAEVSVPANPTQKLIRQGNVYILTGDKTYTLTGQAVK